MNVIRSHRFLACLFAFASLLSVSGVAAENSGGKGQRIFSAGHSFHMFVPKMQEDLAKAANIPGHTQVGRSGIGASYTYQHWDVPEEKNALKKSLRAGEIDVLTLAPIYLPDDGIENFAKLGLDHNPNIRVTVQEFWLPYDVFDVNYKKQKPAPVDRNARTVEQIRSLHGAYFKTMDDHVQALNQKFGKTALFVVPVGQAVVALREKIIAGTAPGLKQQNDLFTDAIGHATPPLQWLTTYCHFAVIYRKSPAGLPCPPALASMADGEALNKLLQQLAWEAATAHALSGVK